MTAGRSQPTHIRAASARAPSRPCDPARPLDPSQFARLREVERTNRGFACSLGNCPYRDSARENPKIVCTLHRGITAGILAELDPTAKLAHFEPRDPEHAACKIEVRRGT